MNEEIDTKHTLVPPVPKVLYKDHPMTEGPLVIFNHIRPRILSEVIDTTVQEFTQTPAATAQIEMNLTSALYAERQRLRRERVNVFTRARYKGDKALWSRVQGGLLQSASLVDRKDLLNQVLTHYTEEIGGHFDPAVYRFATKTLPFLFNWLLNAASVNTFSPWHLTESLESSLKITGEVEALQKLAEKGTILLVPTHQSNIDSVLIGYIIYLMKLPPFAYGAGLNLFSNPVLSFFMRRLGAYTVDRQKSNVLYKHVLKNYSTRILREGIHSIFFPGGGRSRSGAIENKLKLGLLGTGLEAQIKNLQEGRNKPNVYIVPMVMSYHFVLEASSLIDDYLAEAGKHRYIITDDESWQYGKVINFFWRLFKAQSGVSVRIGKPLDVFGNFVNEDGISIGPNGTSIDPVRWLTTRGQLGPEPQRDMEYTRELGSRLGERYRSENTVLTSHLVAFAFFETLRSRYPDLDLYRFIRISLAQRSIHYSDFLAEAEIYHRKVKEAAARGQLFLSDELKTTNVESWVQDGMSKLGVLHDAAVVKHREGVVYTEDMNLLYYYRNRLAGYGFSLLSDPRQRVPGQNDAKGFLA